MMRSVITQLLKAIDDGDQDTIKKIHQGHPELDFNRLPVTWKDMTGPFNYDPKPGTEHYTTALIYALRKELDTEFEKRHGDWRRVDYHYRVPLGVEYISVKHTSSDCLRRLKKPDGTRRVDLFARDSLERRAFDVVLRFLDIEFILGFMKFVNYNDALFWSSEDSHDGKVMMLISYSYESDVAFLISNKYTLEEYKAAIKILKEEHWYARADRRIKLLRSIEQSLSRYNQSYREVLHQYAQEQVDIQKGHLIFEQLSFLCRNYCRPSLHFLRRRHHVDDATAIMKRLTEIKKSLTDPNDLHSLIDSLENLQIYIAKMLIKCARPQGQFNFNLSGAFTRLVIFSLRFNSEKLKEVNDSLAKQQESVVSEASGKTDIPDISM